MAIGAWKAMVIAVMVAALFPLAAGASEVDAATITDIDVGPRPVFPAFSPNTRDYAIRCAGGVNNLTVRVDAPTAGLIEVNGSPATSGVPVNVAARADETIVVEVDDDAGGTDRYWYRCLPADFANYTVSKPGTPGPGYYLVAFGLCFTTCPTSGSFIAILDTNGVPIWYKRTQGPVADQKLLPDGTLAYYQTPGGPGSAFVINNLDGSFVRLARTVGIETDIHDYLRLANGNDLMMSYVEREGVDLTAIGLGPNETAIDGYIQEIDPAGNLVWEWRSQEHVAVEESLTLDDDLIHLNSFEELPGGDLLVSGRSTGTYRIDRTTGQVEWKLGGTTTPESLTIVDDRLDGPIFQHDARVLPDGTITIFDNRQAGETARVVDYEIDTSGPTPTATLVREYERPDGAPSFFMGSARRQPNGNTVINWGATQPMVEEIDSAGNQLLTIEDPTQQQYRAVKYPPGTFNRGQLRALAGGSMINDAPSNVTATAGNGRALVTWSAPSVGGPVDHYTVTSHPDRLTCTAKNDSSCEMTGLTNGTPYRFSVTATTGGYESLPSARSADRVTPSAGAPRPLDSERLTMPSGQDAIAVLFDNGRVVTRRLNGAQISQRTFGPGTPIDLEVVPNPGATPELAVLLDDGGAIRVRVRRAAGSAPGRTVGFGTLYSGDDLEVVDGDLAVLGTSPTSGAVRVATRTTTNTSAGRAAFGAAYSGDDLEVVGGDLAVMGARPIDDRVRAQVKSTNNAPVGTSTFGSAYSGDDLEVRGLSLAVMGTDPATGQVRVQVKTRTGGSVGMANYGSAFSGDDLEVRGGSLAVVGTRSSDNRVRALTKTTTNAALGTASFGSGAAAVDLETVGSDLGLLSTAGTTVEVRVMTIVGVPVATIAYS